MDLEKAKLIYEALEDRKAFRITMLDISRISVMTDCFIIADGDSHTQVQAMADAVEEAMLKKGIHCRAINGYQAAGWILMDYGDIVVHLFYREDRFFYDLERLWSDGVRISREELH